MIYKTKVTPGRNVSAYELSLIIAAIEHRRDVDQTTDGIKEVVNIDDEATRTVVRRWTTMEAAEDWIDFYSQFSPVQSEIVVEE